MIRTTDGTMTKRLAGRQGEKLPTTGFQKLRVIYTAAGAAWSGETGTKWRVRKTSAEILVK